MVSAANALQGGQASTVVSLCAGLSASMELASIQTCVFATRAGKVKFATLVCVMLASMACARGLNSASASMATRESIATYRLVTHHVFMALPLNLTSASAIMAGLGAYATKLSVRMNVGKTVTV